MKKTGQYIPGAYVNQYGLARKVDEDGDNDAEPGCQEKKLMKFDFTPEKIMLLLSNERLRIFEEAWKNPEREDDSLSCVAFTQLVLDTLMEDLNDDDEKYEVAYGCLKLFAEVDINNDGNVNGADLGLLIAAWGECTG